MIGIMLGFVVGLAMVEPAASMWNNYMMILLCVVLGALVEGAVRGTLLRDD